MILERLFEKIIGRPHKKLTSEEVKSVASELNADVGSLTETLKEYHEKDDPLVALMLDIYNDRAQRYTNGHDIQKANSKSEDGP